MTKKKRKVVIENHFKPKVTYEQLAKAMSENFAKKQVKEGEG